MSPIRERMGCGCCVRLQEHRKPSREISREEFNIPFFADPEEEMRAWNEGGDGAGVIDLGEQGRTGDRRQINGPALKGRQREN
jgi:hypothetical protein